MKLLDMTLEAPAANLALEEALLEWAEEREMECLRFWESRDLFVVLGAGSPINSDVNLDECEVRKIPVLRRCTGGGTVVQGPGCLNYTMALDRENREGLDTIASTNEMVLSRIIEAVKICGGGDPTLRGYSDLTLRELKFSGNCQRRRKRFVLFHGTVLFDFDLGLISEVLGAPEKIPEYRADRDHDEFVMNLDVDPKRLKCEIARQWNADDPLKDWPEQRASELALTRYSDQKWIRSI